jgi:hypothetical protein
MPEAGPTCLVNGEHRTSVREIEASLLSMAVSGRVEAAVVALA